MKVIHVNQKWFQGAKKSPNEVNQDGRFLQNSSDPQDGVGKNVSVHILIKR